MTILGHERILAFLNHQLSQGSLAHAYLFVGPQHVGKSLTAAWLSQALLCQGSETKSLFGTAKAERPCGQCQACLFIEKNTHPDLYQLACTEDESTISIEAMRLFLKNLSTSPSLGSRKVAIVHDAHRLTKAAANAFLKSLEEPTETTTLILTSHQPHLLLPTITSRCQTLEFQKVLKVPTTLQEDESWVAAGGLPGLYFRFKEEGSEDDDREKNFFSQLISQSGGQRLLQIEPLFKKTSAHAEKKGQWQHRFALWLDILHQRLRLSLKQQRLDQAQDYRQSIDSLAALQELALTPINLRAHVEAFLLSVSRL